MQNIESILEEFGVSVPEEQAEAFQKKFRDNYKTVNEVAKIERARDGWKARAETAEETVSRLPKDQDPEKLAEALASAQAALESAKTEYEQKLAERDYSDALRTALDGVKFSSAAARRDVEKQIRDAGLPMQDGAILGLGEKIDKIRAEDASAFAAEPAPDSPKPRFTSPTAAPSQAKTRAEIAAITDRAERRAAIAANLNLFESKGE